MERRRHVLGALAGASLLAALSLLAPPLRPALGVLACAAGTALVLTGMALHRPRRRVLWWTVAIALACALVVQVGTAVDGPGSAVAAAAAAASRMAGFVLVPAVLALRLRGRGGRRRPTADLLIAAAGALLLAVQVPMVLGRGPGGPQGWLGAGGPQEWLGAPMPGFDVFALAMVLHLALSRREVERSAVLAMAGGSALLLAELLLAVSGQRILTPGDPVQPLVAGGALLLGLAAVQPDMRSFGEVAPGRHVRSASARLLAALPALATAPVLWGLGLLGVLPAGGEALLVPAGYALAGAAFAVALVALRRAERTAERDPLTGLVNRRGLLPAVEDLRRRAPGEPLEVCLVDLDDFKQVNDSRGHEVGDALLVEVGRRLEAAVGERGVVSRTGGDEFLVVVAAAAGEGGAGDVVLAALDPPFDCAGAPTLVSASVGVVALRPGTSPSGVLADADVAMYAAKQAGKGRALTYRPELRDRVLGDFALLEQLRTLLDGGDPDEVGRLVVLYQPIVALDPVRVTGAEALVRWEHPRLGVLGPDSFLGLVEGAGLGARLDEVVMQRAAGQLAAWDAAGLPRLEVNLNLGIGSMRRPNLSRTVGAIVARHGLTPDRFHLEITEHDELPAEGATASAFDALAEGGFQISLDDFGVGYTSLTYLRRFPVSIVKLDKSLTSLVDEHGEVPLMQGIAALCRALDVKLLAEGVESADQIPALRQLGVEFAQGFHFARPLGAEAFASLVERAERGEDVTGELGVAPPRAGRGREEGDTPAGAGRVAAPVTLGAEPADGS